MAAIQISVVVDQLRKRCREWFVQVTAVHQLFFEFAESFSFDLAAAHIVFSDFRLRDGGETSKQDGRDDKQLFHWVLQRIFT